MYSFCLPAALKRSFDTEELNDVPSFSTTSSISTPASTSSSQFFLNSKSHEGQEGGGQPPLLAFNNNNLGSTSDYSNMTISSSHSQVNKSHPLVSSLSFSRGTMSKPVIHNNGSSVTRATSFQSRANPNGYSMLIGPGSDDSLHSSTSSLEYSGGGGCALNLDKLGLYTSLSPQEVYNQTEPHIPQQHIEQDINLRKKNNLKKFSAFGSVFRSQIDQGSGMSMGVQDPQSVNHGLMPILDLQFQDGGGIVSMERRRAGDRMSPGLRYANAQANWNGHLHNASSFGDEGYCVSKNHCQQQGSHILKAPHSNAPRLNKFPLDLGSLLSSASTNSSIKAQGGSMSPQSPKPLLRSTGDIQHQTTPPSTSVSPSASLCSLDSSADIPHFSVHQSHLPFSAYSPTTSQGSCLPGTSCSLMALSPAHIPQLEIASESKMVQAVPHKPSSDNHSNSTPIKFIKGDMGDARDTVDSILQRIASFSKYYTIQTVGTQLPAVQSNSSLSSAAWCPAETTPTWKQGIKKEEGKMFWDLSLSILY